MTSNDEKANGAAFWSVAIVSCAIIGVVGSVPTALSTSADVVSVLRNTTGVTAMLFYRASEVDSLIALRDAQRLFSEEQNETDDANSENWAVPIRFVTVEVTTPSLQWMINAWGIRDVPTLRAWIPRKTGGGTFGEATLRRAFDDMSADLTLVPMRRFLSNVRRRVRGSALPMVSSMDDLNTKFAGAAVSRYQALLLVYGGKGPLKGTSKLTRNRAIGAVLYTTLVVGQAALRSAELSDSVARGLYDAIPGLPRKEAFIVFATAETLQSRTPRLLPVEGWQQVKDNMAAATLVASSVVGQMDSPLSAPPWERFDRSVARRQRRVGGALELQSSEDWLGFLEASVDSSVGLLVSSSPKSGDASLLLASLRLDPACRDFDVVWEQPMLLSTLRLRGKNKSTSPMIAVVVSGSRFSWYNTTQMEAAHSTEICKFLGTPPQTMDSHVFPRYPAPTFHPSSRRSEQE